MKFKDIINFMSDDEYRGLEMPSYSLLKSLDDEGPNILINPVEKKGKALEFGTLVDILLTDPASKDDIFHTTAIEKPTSSLLVLADALIAESVATYKSVKHLLDKGYVLEKAKALGLWSKMSDDKIIERFDLSIFYEYITQSIEAQGKIVLEPEVLAAAEYCANVLLTHDYTNELFKEDEGSEVLKQVPLIFKYKECKLKGKVDLLRVNHNTKTVNIYDIKTGAELPSRFENSYLHFKYYLQALLYTIGVEYFLWSNKLTDYKIESFQFIYISKKLKDYPVIIDVPFKLMDTYLDDWVDSNFQRRKGLNTLIDEYVFYTTRNIYNCEKIVIDLNGKLSL